MSTYTKPILELIAKRPGIRTVEIADIVDCDIEQVKPAILAEIEAGKIVVKPVIAPNGRNADAFVPSPEIVERYGPKAAAPTENHGTSTPTPVEQPKSRVQLAETYLATHGRATVEKMREVIQCDKKQHPNSYLNIAIGKGRIIWEGGVYRLGTPEERVAARDQGTHTTRTTTPKAPATPFQTVAAQPTVVAPTPAAPAAPATEVDQPTEPSEFACALWSDGELMMVRDGNELAVLSKAETDLLRRYLGSLPQLEAA